MSETHKDNEEKLLLWSSGVASMGVTLYLKVGGSAGVWGRKLSSGIQGQSPGRGSRM